MKRGTPRHPKTKALARRLSVPIYSAIGILESLWHFVAEFTPEGDLGRFSDVAIADAVGWAEDPEDFVEALVEVGWLERNTEHRIIVHHWNQHAEDSVRKFLNRHRKGFLPIYGQSTDTLRTKYGHFTDSGGSTRAGKGIGNGSFLKEEGVGETIVALALPSDDFGRFREFADAAELPASEVDWEAAREEWKRLEIAVRLAAVQGLKDRVAAGEWSDPAFRPLPQNYLKNRIWQRPIKLSKPPARSKMDEAERILMENLAHKAQRGMRQ